MDLTHVLQRCRDGSLEAAFPHFVDAIRYLDDDVANAYVTAGELILDIALLRSLDDYVADPTAAEAMRLINRDESRHIAVDYHLAEYYASDAYTGRLRAGPRRPLGHRARGLRAFAHAVVGMYSEAELAKVRRQSYAELAEEALAAKET